MRYVGVVLGFLSALVVWPLLPFIFLVAFGWLLLQTYKDDKKAKLEECPPPVSEPMLGQVFAEARRNIHALNVDYMERCYEQNT